MAQSSPSLKAEEKTDTSNDNDSDNISELKSNESLKSYGINKLSYVIALINKKSGGKRGQKIGKELEKLGVITYCLFEISKDNNVFESLATKIYNNKNNIIVIIAGGDGTMSWGCSILDSIILTAKEDMSYPKIVPFPVGTGNDFSRASGWGNANPSIKTEIILDILTNIHYANITHRISDVDRWRIIYKFDDINEDESIITDANNSVKKAGDSDGIQYCIQCNPKSKLYKHLQNCNDLPLRYQFLCYLSLGYDAQVTYDFAQDRKKHPKKYKNQFFNKGLYVIHGLKHFIDQINPINNDLTVNADGEDIILPKVSRSFKLMNINSGADGIYFWGNDSKENGNYEDNEPKLNDKKIELISTEGARHMIEIKTRQTFAKKHKKGGERLKQASDYIKINITNAPAYLQIDGEGYKIDKKCEIKVKLHDKLPLLIGYNNPLGVDRQYSINNKKNINYNIDPLYRLIKQRIMDNCNYDTRNKNNNKLFKLFDKTENRSISVANINRDNVLHTNLRRQKSV